MESALTRSGSAELELQRRGPGTKSAKTCLSIQYQELHSSVSSHQQDITQSALSWGAPKSTSACISEARRFQAIDRRRPANVWGNDQAATVALCYFAVESNTRYSQCLYTPRSDFYLRVEGYKRCSLLATCLSCSSDHHSMFSLHHL